MMRKLLLSTASVIALSVPAFAADMPVKAQRYAPVQMYNWSGFYVGIHGGYGWANFDAPAGAAGFDRRLDGGFIGGQVGFNWQAAGSPWVLGVEFDSAGANIDTGSNVTLGGVTGGLSSEVDYLGSLRFRGGYAWDRTMLYGTVGLGWARNEVRSAVAFPGFFAAGSQHNTNVGVAAGFGLEHAFAGPWSAKIEYVYYGLDREHYGLAASAYNPDLNIHTVKVGLNYRFGQGGGFLWW